MTRREQKQQAALRTHDQRVRAIHAGVWLLLLGLTLLAYWSVWEHDFIDIFDDGEYVFENEMVLRGLTVEGLIWSFRGEHAANYHPLTWLSLMLDVSLFGTGPRGFHLTNLALHLANGVLLFELLCRLTGQLLPSAVVACLFCVHPLHVESVAWIAERKDVLSQFWGLWAVWAYERFARTGRRSWYSALIVAFLLSLLAKQTLVTLPCLLLLLDHWPLGRWSARPSGQESRGTANPAREWRGLIVEKLPLLAVSGLFLCAVVAAQWSGGAIASTFGIPWEQRVGNAILSYGLYLRKAFWPVDLAVFYPHPGSRLNGTAVAISGGVLLVMTGLAVAVWHRRPAVSVGWFWFLGTLVPMIGLVQVGQQGMADRYTYFPLLGNWILLVWGGAENLFTTRAARLAGLAICAAAVLALVACTREQVAVWENGTRLLEHTQQVTRDNPWVETNLGGRAYEAGDFESARRHLHDALRLVPANHRAHYTLGLIAFREGDQPAAARHFELAAAGDPASADYRNMLGITYVRLGRWEEAFAQYRAGLVSEPDNPHLWLNLAIASEDQRHWEQAVEAYRRVLLVQPDNLVVAQHLQALLERLRPGLPRSSPAEG